MEGLEPAPATAGERAHQYTDGVDTFDADPSFDLWGGGGLVSTTTDVARFFRALFDGRVYDNPQTIELMTTPAMSAEGAHIALGIAGRDFSGHRLWGHGGYWGVYAGFVPDVGVALSVAVLERNALGAVATELLPGSLELALTLASDG
jgi:D-alanyl-D-alanine carboxypeptidase